MEDWKDAAIIVGLFSGVAGLLAVFVRVGNALRSRAKWEQQLMSDVGDLKAGQVAGRERQEKFLDAFNRHVSDSGVHLNPIVEQRMYEEDKEWRRRVETKLDTLTAGGKG